MCYLRRNPSLSVEFSTSDFAVVVHASPSRTFCTKVFFPIYKRAGNGIVHVDRDGKGTTALLHERTPYEERHGQLNLASS